MSDLEITKYLEWDSKFFKKPIYLVKGEINTIINEVHKLENDVLLYYFSNINIPSLKDYLVDTKVTYQLDLNRTNPEKPNNEIKSAIINEQNKEDFYKLAIVSSHLSRFRQLDIFDPKQVDLMYMIWVDNMMESPEEYFISEFQSNGNTYGMATCKSTNKIGRIELVALAEEARNKGIGKDLIRNTIIEAKNHNLETLTVTTQDSNISAKQLYQKCGFTTSTIEYIYHIFKKDIIQLTP